MPDEHDNEPGQEGPHRPDHTRRRTIHTLQPTPAGTVYQEQRLTPHSPAATEAPPSREHTTDPRFADAPLTDAERKALFDAPNLEEVCTLLGRFQEDREQDGRLPQAVPAESKPLPLDRYRSAAQQTAMGIRPTAEEMAYIQDGPNAPAQQDRTNEFLSKRKQLNEQLFHQSRQWGAAIHRQTVPGASDPEADRIWGPRGIQGWRADIADAIHRPGAHQTATQGRPPTLDPRFEDAPITQTEIKALKETKTPEAAAQLLNGFHEARVKDGRLPEPSASVLESSLISQVLAPHELSRLGLMPTARDLGYLQAAAADDRELECTLEFIADRRAQNARWHLDAEYAARQQESLARDRTSSYWYDRVLTSRSAERDARTERAERRTDLQQRREQREQQRDDGPRQTPGPAREGRDGGGRGR